MQLAVFSQLCLPLWPQGGYDGVRVALVGKMVELEASVIDHQVEKGVGFDNRKEYGHVS